MGVRRFIPLGRYFTLWCLMRIGGRYTPAASASREPQTRVCLTLIFFTRFYRTHQVRWITTCCSFKGTIGKILVLVKHFYVVGNTLLLLGLFICSVEGYYKVIVLFETEGLMWLVDFRNKRIAKESFESRVRCLLRSCFHRFFSTCYERNTQGGGWDL